MRAPKSSISYRIKKAQPKRGSHNRDLYNSHSWRKFRAARLEEIAEQQLQLLRTSGLPDVVRLNLYDMVPLCTVCLRLVLAGAYEKAERGDTLDHIKPVNPDNFRDTAKGYFGEAFDPDNVQPMCKRHHGKKSIRDGRYMSQRPDG